MKLAGIAALISVFVAATAFFPESNLPPKMNLSEYGFFTGPLADMKPAEQVFPYEVNAPLFTDYAEKARFIMLPKGKTMRYDVEHAFELPVGAVIIKNFFYYRDVSRPESGRDVKETRLLIREENAWKALTYIWNAEQTDAVLEVAGAAFPVRWVDASGKKRSADYVVPNVNQCKGCHSYDGQFTPIGLSARQLNRDVKTGNSIENQLLVWAKNGLLELPDQFDAAQAPHLADYRHSELPNDSRARAYLDGNCAHCHNAHGPASTSGLFLEASQKDPERIGVGKAPVAAGRGSGNRQYSIVPGKPNESILLYRMESVDPGIQMPELGRSTVHKEGVELIRNWIKEMK